MSNSKLAVDKGIDRFDKWFKDNLVYIAAFFLPVISMLIVYSLKDIYPFGDDMYLRSDNYHQYTPYLQILQDNFKNFEGFFYTWKIGAGMNFLAIIAYYLASPFNLILLFFKGRVGDIVAFFIISKMGLSSLTTTYYLVKKHNKKTLVASLFGMAYALSAYFAAFNWNIMWLDCMFILPLIILGLERLVKEGKYLLYIISLGVAIFSNYYIGIMLCIFSVLYFIYLIFTQEVSDDFKKPHYYMVTTVKYGISSLIAGGLAAIVILPEYYNLLTTLSAKNEFPKEMDRYFSVFFMFFRSLMFVPVADLKYPQSPNIYCSVVMFLLIPLYFLSKKINVKERIGKFVLIAAMLLSFNLNIPNYLWHGMHFPNSLPCRESFIYIFLIVTTGYEAAIHIKDFTDRQIGSVFAGVVGFVLLLEETMRYVFTDTSSSNYFTELTSGIETNMFKIIYYSLAAITVYAFLIYIYKRKTELHGFIVYLLLLVSMTELTYNMKVTSIPNTVSRDGYYESNSAYYKLNDVAKDDAKKEDVIFFRSEEESDRTKNDGGLFNYQSMSTFSSVASANIQHFYKAIGLKTSFNAYSYVGHTPLTAALFSVKYEFTGASPSIPNNFDYLAEEEYTKAPIGQHEKETTNIPPSHLYLYKNKACLPLGFMIDSNTNQTWYTESGNPFDVQNSFLKSAIPGFGKSIFHKLSTDGNGTIQTMYSLDPDDTFVLSGEQDTYDVYFYIP
ncbi:MAG: YfhO family protein, partial [Lachnospiraceae bacterium]|nr:YfhO family protein [Lachnospiraceae bacterium]